MYIAVHTKRAANILGRQVPESIVAMSVAVATAALMAMNDILGSCLTYIPTVVVAALKARIFQCALHFSVLFKHCPTDWLSRVSKKIKLNR